MPNKTHSRTGQKAAEPRALLCPAELSLLTETWELWIQKAASPDRFISRARLHLFFLLARFAGMRPAEISVFPEQGTLDRQTGLLQLKDRKLFLSPAAMRPIRRILALAEAENPDFLKLDAGFLRRTFYEMGKLAGLLPEACAPRALRYARGLELLEMRMPPQMVAAYLGLANPLQLGRLLSHKAELSADINTFTAILRAFQTDYRAGKLFLQTGGIEITAISSLEDLADIEPVVGNPFAISIPPGLIFPSPEPLPMENCLRCKLLSVVRDDVETRLRLALLPDIELLAVIDSDLAERCDFQRQTEINVYIPAHAVAVTSLS